MYNLESFISYISKLDAVSRQVELKRRRDSLESIWNALVLSYYSKGGWSQQEKAAVYELVKINFNFQVQQKDADNKLFAELLKEIANMNR